ncbi:uncharacterized protein LOC133922561 isoform X1 [Phragmites australis]|uniref:uncharacterized protein LOC133922561 isoform X1 n=1 Tax=Phragmites australis TaxID=29695 RepID=UPI002D7775E3|nr:uncharacterized protein LOC133922561 isoform X1 [Phragmites australis]
MAGKGPPSWMRAESLLRGACAAMAAAGALLLGLSTETKTVLFVQKKAVPKDVQALCMSAVCQGADRGGRGRGGVPRRPARQQVPLLAPLPRRRLPASQERAGMRLLPPRQGVRVHGVCDHGGGAAGVRGGADRRGGPAVEQALQHLHQLLRAGRRRHALQPARRRRHGRPLRLLGPRPLPPPLLLGGRAVRADLRTDWSQASSVEMGCVAQADSEREKE